MTSVDKLKAYAIACGLPEQLVVDEHTLILSSKLLSLEQLETKEAVGKGLEYHMNLQYPYEVYNKESSNGFDIHGSQHVVFIVRENKLVMCVPIYEIRNPTVSNNIVSITGHERTATVVLNDLPSSFSYHTR